MLHGKLGLVHPGKGLGKLVIELNEGWIDQILMYNKLKNGYLRNWVCASRERPWQIGNWANCKCMKTYLFIFLQEYKNINVTWETGSDASRERPWQIGNWAKWRLPLQLLVKLQQIKSNPSKYAQLRLYTAHEMKYKNSSPLLSGNSRIKRFPMDFVPKPPKEMGRDGSGSQLASTLVVTFSSQ